MFLLGSDYINIFLYIYFFFLFFIFSLLCTIITMLLAVVQLWMYNERDTSTLGVASCGCKKSNDNDLSKN